MHEGACLELLSCFLSWAGPFLVFFQKYFQGGNWMSCFWSINDSFKYFKFEMQILLFILEWFWSHQEYLGVLICRQVPEFLTQVFWVDKSRKVLEAVHR